MAPESARVDKPKRTVPKGGEAPAKRGGRGGFTGRGREFDRISGTGRGKEVSKGGAGGHNWGSADEEARKAEHGEVAAEEAAPAVEGEEKPEGAAAAATEGAAEAPAPVVEEVDTSKTFDEVIAEREAKRTGALFAVAKEDTSKLMEQFKGA